MGGAYEPGRRASAPARSRRAKHPLGSVFRRDLGVRPHRRRPAHGLRSAHSLAVGPERPTMRNRVAPAACTLAGHTSPSGRTRRRRSLICALALGALAALPAPAGADLSATLDVVADGNGAVTISRASPTVPDTCVGSLAELKECIRMVSEGEVVTLTALPNPEAPDVDPPTTFVGWSDARCTGTGPCTLAMDGDPLTVTALFSPQRVVVRSIGPGTVTTPAGDTCPAATEDGRPFFNCGRFPLGSQVTLQANPSPPTDPSARPVVATWEPSFCDAPAPRKGNLLCTVSVYGPTESKVGFGDKPGGARTPTI